MNMTLFFVLRCCTTIREGMKRMLGRDKNRVLWQSTDFFSGERNRKLASTAACITELEMCVGSHATSFSLYFLLSHYLSFSLSRSTHTLTHSRSQPTLHISVHGSPGRYTVYYCTTRGLKPSQHFYKNDIPQSCCIFTLPFFYSTCSLFTYLHINLYLYAVFLLQESSLFCM